MVKRHKFDAEVIKVAEIWAVSSMLPKALRIVVKH